MERSDELVEIRKKLWLRYIALRKKYDNAVSISFHQLWYEILVKHMISESAILEVCEDVFTKLEQKLFVASK